MILLVAIALRLGWGLRQPTDDAGLSVLPDQVEYLQLARNLLAGAGLQFTDPRFGQRVWAYRTPGYPVLVAACGGDVRLVRVVQALLDVSSVAAIYFLARRWLSHGESLFAAGIVAVDPMLIYFSGLILSETLFVAMLAWGMVLLTRTGRRAEIFAGGGALILAIAVLVRPSALLLGPILMIAARGKSGVRVAAISVGMTVLVLFPWAWRNHARLGEWVWTSTNSGITQYDGFNPRATGASDQTFLRDMPQVRPMGEIERSQYLGALADQFIREHPGQCAELAVAKIGRLWSVTPLSAQFGRPLYAAVTFAYAAPLFALAIIGLIRRAAPADHACSPSPCTQGEGRGEGSSDVPNASRQSKGDPHPSPLPEYRERGQERIARRATGSATHGLPVRAKVLLLIPALYFTVIHAASVAGLRYRLPAEPPLAILAAGAIWGRHGKDRGEAQV